MKNIDIISSIKISNIHPSINKANQESEAVDMIELVNFESRSLHYSSTMNLLIKNKNQWSIGSNGQRYTLTNLVEKSTKLRCEVGHMEFIEINIIM